MKKRSKIIFVIFILFFIILLSYITIENRQKISNAINRLLAAEGEEETAEEEETYKFSYQIKKGPKDGSKTDILVVVEDKNGIEEIEYDNGQVIKCDNKEKVGLDLRAEYDVEYIYKIKNSLGEVKEEKIELKEKDLLTQVSEITESGQYQLKIFEQTYNVNATVFNGDQVWDSKTFGTANDIGTASEYAKNMVVVKVEGNLTINSGATITTVSSSYGGPKGFLLYVTGDVINNGNITMTSKGAKAVGQDIYLLKNANGLFEFIPAVGGNGGARVTGSKGQYFTGNNGNPGINGTNRSTGGGGSGGFTTMGAAGTSFSGGSAGGGTCWTWTAGSGAGNGGAGGAGVGTSRGAWAIGAGGGAGNPGGSGSGNAGTSGGSGTGGLLIIVGNNVTNNGVITSNGSNGGNGYRAGGGGSGAGSINIFYRDSLSSGTITATGGTRGRGTKGSECAYGGNGGNGSITTTKFNNNM